MQILIDLLPLQYENLFPEEKFIKSENNPPEMSLLHKEHTLTQFRVNEFYELFDLL